MAVRAGRALPFPARIARSEATLPLGLLAPTIIYLTLLILVPVAQAILLSFQAEDGALTLDAYQRMVSEAAFADSLRNTALLLVPRDYFEAAELFGASRWKRTLLVVLPLLRPSLQSALIIRTVFAFQKFAVVLTLAGRQFPVLAYEAYDWYANVFNSHVAAA